MPNATRSTRIFNTIEFLTFLDFLVMLKCQAESYLREFTTVVTSVSRSVTCPFRLDVELEDTILFPEGIGCLCRLKPVAKPYIVVKSLSHLDLIPSYLSSYTLVP